MYMYTVYALLQQRNRKLVIKVYKILNIRVHVYLY